MDQVLTDEQVQQFHENGFVVLPGWFDIAADIEPIQQGVYDIIGLVAEKHGVSLNRSGFTHAGFDDGFMELVAADRKLGSIVYDAVKQLASFVRLTATANNEAAFGQLRGTNVVGIAGNGSGIRIDIPGEEKFRAAYHQEYPAQFRSLDGMVIWSPLRSMTAEMGPVQICPASHGEGLLQVYSESEGALGRTRAYALRLVREAEIVEQYPPVEPLAQAGDALLMDFLTVHASGYNRSARPRWSMQLRYFNFTEPTGATIDWSGSFNAGIDITTVHPNLLVELSRQ